MSSNNILFDEGGRLRSGWRFAVFTATFLPISALLSVAAYTLAVGTEARRAGPSTVFLLLNGAFSLLAALAVGYLCGRIFERLDFPALGASFRGRWLVNFAVGMGISVGTFAAAAVLGIIAGGLRFSLNTAPTGEILWTLGLTFLVFAAAAAFEEALFRGYILQTFVRSDLTAFGVLLTSVLFATVHNDNPAASPLSWANTFIAGIWFALAYLKTRDLWMAFGLHLAWNWAQGSIFGVEVSGLSDLVRDPLMREMDLGPSWLTGGDYGIEGGLITTVAIILSSVLIYFAPLGFFNGNVVEAGPSPRSTGS